MMVRFSTYYVLIYIVLTNYIDKLYSSDSTFLSNSFLVCYTEDASLIEENISLLLYPNLWNFSPNIYQSVIGANTNDDIESNPNQSKKIESMALIQSYN